MYDIRIHVKQVDQNLITRVVPEINCGISFLYFVAYNFICCEVFDK